MRPLLTAQDMDRALTRIAHEIIERHPNTPFPAIVGIRRRGEFLAHRIHKKLTQILEKKTGFTPIHTGVLDINLYRDDLTRVAEQPVIRETVIDFPIDDQPILLVDDVLYTGRTIRCALQALTDLGRPKSIELAVLIDRGHRELPIRADYVGKNIPTQKNEVVHVQLTELDKEDAVIMETLS